MQARIPKIKLNDLLRVGNAVSTIKQLNISQFYKQMILKFQSTFHSSIRNQRDARAQVIWYNEDVKIGDKVIFIKRLYDAGLVILNDIISRNGRLLNFPEFKRKYPQAKVDFLTYFGIVSAIPSPWKELIRNNPRDNLTSAEINEFYIMIGGKRIPAKAISTKYIYRVSLKG